MTAKKKSKLIEGQILRIDLNNETHSYARVLREPLIAFYDRLYRVGEKPSIEEIVALPIAFKIWVMNYAVTKGLWSVVARFPLAPDLEEVPHFFKQDALSGQLTIYQATPELAPTYELPATYEECVGLEEAAVWDPHHVEERLRDHFSGRPNKWIEAPKTSEEFEVHREEMRRKREAARRGG